MSDPIELLFLHPLPFDGGFWSPMRTRFPDISSYAPTMYTLGASLEDVAKAVLDLTTSNRLIVIGNSIGGSCALEVAAAAPSRVEHLVLVGTKAGHRPEPDYRDWALNLLRTDGVGAIWDQVWRPLLAASVDPTIVERAEAEALAVPAELLAAGIAMFHGRRDRAHLIDEWTGPITVVTGSEDVAPRAELSRAMARRARQGTFHAVTDCGHYVAIEQPDAFANVLEEVIEATIQPMS